MSTDVHFVCDKKTGNGDLMVRESDTRNPKVASSSLRSGRNCRWGGCLVLSSISNTTTEVSLSKA